MANWYSLYLATASGAEVTDQSGNGVDLRRQFILSGSLTESQDPNFRGVFIDNATFPATAFARDLGSISNSAASTTVFAIGMAPGDATEGAIRIIASTGETQSERYLYSRAMADVDTAVSHLAIKAVQFTNTTHRPHSSEHFYWTILTRRHVPTN